MSEVEHLILTRYNLAYPWAKRTSVHLDSSWLKERARLMESVCAPSVAASVQGTAARWVVLCSDESTRLVRDMMDELVERHSWVMVEYLPPDVDYGEVVDRALGRIGATGRYVLSSRLDSDDAIGSDFVRLLNSTAQELVGIKRVPFPIALNFPVGAQLFEKRLYWQVDPMSAFISLLEDRTEVGQLTTCYGYPHTAWHKHARHVKQIWSSHPAWLQVIHGDNEANVPCGVVARAGRVSFDSFNINSRSIPESPRVAMGWGPTRAAAQQVAQLVARRRAFY